MDNKEKALEMLGELGEEIEQMKKENAELKKAVTEKNSVVERLKNGSLLKELTERVKQQAEQIEKMKCCFNCKYGNGSAYNFECIGCLWELAK